MKKFGLLGCGVLVAIGLLLALVGVGQYNRLVSLDEGTKTAWAQVESAYQRRADLIPNLVNTVKGAADFEQDTLEAVVNARSKVSQITFSGTPNAEQLRQFQASQGELSQALSRLLVVAEQYPVLKATDAFRDLQSQLEGTENRISVERNRFNQAAQSFNTARRTFPTSLLAGLFGFKEKAYFESTPGADTPPVVDFTNR